MPFVYHGSSTTFSRSGPVSGSEPNSVGEPKRAQLNQARPRPITAAPMTMDASARSPPDRQYRTAKAGPASRTDGRQPTARPKTNPATSGHRPPRDRKSGGEGKRGEVGGR